MNDETWETGPEDDRFAPEEVDSLHDRNSASPNIDSPSGSETPEDAPDNGRGGNIDIRPDGRIDQSLGESRDSRLSQTQDTAGNSESSQSGDDSGELADEASRLAPFILAHIQQHLHLPLQMPDPRAIRELKEADPTAYEFWMDQIRGQTEHQRWIERAPYELPAMAARRGQYVGFAAVLVMAVLVGWVAFLNHPWLAGVLGVLDFVGIAAVFVARDSVKD